MGGFPPFHRFSKGQRSASRFTMGSRNPIVCMTVAWVISFSEALHLHIHTRELHCAQHPVSASTQDKYGNEWINKQKWNHIAPWERKHDRAATSVAMREGRREVVGCIYSMLIHFHPSSGDGSLPWSFASRRCVRSAPRMTVVQGRAGTVYRKRGGLTET